MRKLHNQRGDTIIEVLFAMTIIGVVLAAAYSIASKNLQVSESAKERIVATELATAQLDQLKALDEIPDSANNFCIDVTLDPAIIDDTEPECFIDQRYELSITKDDSEYIISVVWIPPGGSDNDQSKYRVEMRYRDYDFSLSGSGVVAAYVDSYFSGATTASVGVKVLDATGVLDRGLVYGLSKTPTVGDGSSLIVSNTSNRFTTNVTIDPSKTYYARAFVRTVTGYVYSSPVTINGSSFAADKPTVETGTASSITQTTATVTGEVVSANGPDVTERGVVFHTSPSPTLNNGVATAGSGLGNFSASLTGLKPDKNYYARAYATSSNGTSYGDDISFRTPAIPGGIPIVEAPKCTGITSTYYVSSVAVTWQTARQIAQNSGGHLVTISSEAENSCVSSLVASTNEKIWIGFNDLQTEGQWRWENGEPVTFTKWAPGEPNDYLAPDPNTGQTVGEDGAVMNWNSASAGNWNDWHAFNNAYFVVEFD